MFKSSASKQPPITGAVVKQGHLVKRSQNKKRFSLVNYKSRWFVLTDQWLAYYEGDSEVTARQQPVAPPTVAHRQQQPQTLLSVRRTDGAGRRAE